MHRHKSSMTNGKADTSRNVGEVARWLWHTWQGYRRQALINVAVGLAIVVIDLSFVWSMKQAIDVATGQERSIGLTTAFILLGMFIVLQIALGLSSRWIKAVLGVRAQNSMKRAIFTKLLESRWLDMKRYHTGDLLNRLERDVNDVIGFLTESLPSLVTTIFQFLGAFLFLFYMDSNLALIVVFILPFFLVISRLYVRKMRRLTHHVRQSESRIQSLIQESLQHTLIIKTLGKTRFVVRRLSDNQQTLRSQIVSRTLYSSISSGVMNAGFALGYLVTFIWGVTQLHEGHISYGALIAFIQLVAQIQAPVRSLTKFIPVFIGSFTASERLMELMDIPAEQQADDIKIAEAPAIEIASVDFAYEAASRHILKGFSATFPARSASAVVGETGAGKTTLIRLLLSVLQPTGGSLSLVARQGERIPVSTQTRCNFAYVPQGNTLISGTIRENLQLGNPSATETEMREALALAACDFILDSPAGLEARCGEVGDGLSEGQAQRVSIARALLRRSPVMLFDEATSSLDNATEARVVRNIIDHCRQSTLIFVTHRPEVLRYCSQVIELKKLTE